MVLGEPIVWEQLSSGLYYMSLLCWFGQKEAFWQVLLAALLDGSTPVCGW